MKFNRIVYIEWLDHSSHETSSWKDAKTYKELKPAKCRSIGFVVNEDSDFITIACSNHFIPETEDFEEENNFSGDMCIIKSCITKLKEIKYE